MELHLFVRWFEFITTWLHLKTNRNRKHVEHSHTHDFCCWMNDAIEWNSSWTNALAENFFPVETEHTRRQMKSESMLDRVLRTNIVSVGYGISPPSSIGGNFLFEDPHFWYFHLWYFQCPSHIWPYINTYVGHQHGHQKERIRAKAWMSVFYVRSFIFSLSPFVVRLIMMIKVSMPSF